MAQIFPTDFEEKLTMAQDDYILFSDSEDGNKIKKAQYKNLKGEKGDPGTAATITVGSTTTGTPGSSASVTNSGTSSAAVLDFTIPKGEKGDPGTPGQDGEDGAAATITVGTTTTLPAGSSATVENVGTSKDAVLNFGIPEGDAGTGDVNGPASSTDGNLAAFDGATGKLIKDSGVQLTDINTKCFFLAGTTGAENLNIASAAMAWYSAGKAPIIIYSNKVYILISHSSSSTVFAGLVNNNMDIDNSGYTTIGYPELTFAHTGDTVSSISAGNGGNTNILRTGKNYTTPYTPQYNGSPATKKYVDDGLSAKADTSSLGTAAACDTGTGSGNVPVLDSNGKLNKTTLPGVALTDTFTVSTSSDLTSLSSAEQGDLAIVTTENKTYVLASEPYSTAANWKEILSPTGGVTSVNSQTGAVTLDADDISDSTTTNKFVTATDKTTWSGKQDALTLPATPTQGNLVTWGANNKSLIDGGAIPTGVPNGGTDGQVVGKVSGSVAWTNVYSTITVTLTSAGWSSSTQTVSATGVTASNTVIVSPDPSDLDDYAEKGVYCSGQGSGTLTFTCDTIPTASITVNVLIMNI